MDIQALKLFVTESEINAVMARYLPPDVPVTNLQVRLTPEGVVVQGEYKALMVKMSFETLWEVSAAGAEVQVRLASAKVAGLPAGMLRGVLFKMLRDAAAGEAGVSVEEECLRVNLQQALEARGLPLRLNLTAVRCSLHSLVIEAGPV